MVCGPWPNEVSQQWRHPQWQLLSALYSCIACCSAGLQLHGTAGHRPTLEQSLNGGVITSFYQRSANHVSFIYSFICETYFISSLTPDHNFRPAAKSICDLNRLHINVNIDCVNSGKPSTNFIRLAVAVLLIVELLAPFRGGTSPLPSQYRALVRCRRLPQNRKSVLVNGPSEKSC